VPLYTYRCIDCGHEQDEFRRSVEERDRAAVCDRCERPALVIFTPPRVWHPTASDRFGETWGKNTRAEGPKSLAQKLADVRRDREERPPPEPLYISGGPEE
jgi:putative FmdB family regulatory protein